MSETLSPAEKVKQTWDAQKTVNKHRKPINHISKQKPESTDLDTTLSTGKNTKSSPFEESYHRKQLINNSSSSFDHLGELLFHISQYHDLMYRYSLFYHHYRTKNQCDDNRFFSLHMCDHEGTSHENEKSSKKWKKLPCTSFFCEDCHNYLNKRLKQSLKTKLMDARHRFGVFTVPEPVRDQLDYDNINQLFDTVRETLQEYFDSYTESEESVDVGILAFPHTYGSKDMKWKPHINVLVSGYGFAECTHGLHEDIEKLDRFDNCNKEYHMVQTTYLDYDEIRSIYSEKLKDKFGVEVESPQINWDTKDNSGVLNKFDNSNHEGLKPENLTNNLISYVRKLPITLDDIQEFDSETVSFSTFKRDKLDLEPLTVGHEEFYKRIVQHIPPKRFMSVRAWGVYSSNHTHRHHYYPIDEDQEPDKVKCPICDQEMDLVLLSSPVVVFLDTNKLDLKDSLISEKSELLYDPPPDELKPPPDLDFSGSDFSKSSKSPKNHPSA